MRPSNLIARDQLERALRNTPLLSAAELAARAGVSVPTALRILREQQTNVMRLGTTKNARYVWRRALRGVVTPLPVYRVDATGRGHELTSLSLVAPHGAVMDLDASGWPVTPEHQAGWWDGLPYPFYDMRPQGFLGRHFAHYFARDLQLSINPMEWSDDDIVYALALRGADVTGNLIVGDAAYALWNKVKTSGATACAEADLPGHYAALAGRAAEAGIAGSSAAGEFPKFTAKRDLAGRKTPHVIVKFSGAATSGTVQRWSDLLICEHLALEALYAALDIAVAYTRIVQHQGRTFIEVERFDRIGDWGRSELVSLATLDAVFVGSTELNWRIAINGLEKRGLVSRRVVNEVHLLWWYGQLIANSDMHLGNLSFQFTPHPQATPTLKIAPIYDMLPMLYAPLAGGEVPLRVFELHLPLPRERDIWIKAATAALVFWEMASKDARVSAGFRKICADNFAILEGLAGQV
ncbi:MAG: type II toxin-antitoxin system HipA family toxin YjjJ [Pseudomonadota bacterium]